MDFDRAQQTLEALYAQCPHTDARDVDIWVSAVARAREALVELQIAEDRTCVTGTAAEVLSRKRDCSPRDQVEGRPLKVVG
jgi:hypothetical protein